MNMKLLFSDIISCFQNDNSDKRRLYPVFSA